MPPPTPPYSDDDIIAGIHASDAIILRYIYTTFLKKWTNYVTNNSGSVEDAEDIFQEILIDLPNKLTKNALKKNATFHGWFFMVCKYTWLTFLRKKRGIRVTFSEDLQHTIKDETKLSIESELKMTAFEKIFKEKLCKPCQEILLLFYNNKNYKEIAAIMNYTPTYAKKKKCVCMKKLFNLVQEDSLLTNS